MASGAGERTQFRASFGTNSGAWQSTPAQESRPVTLWAVLAKLPDYLCPQQFEALPRRDGEDVG